MKLVYSPGVNFFRLSRSTLCECRVCFHGSLGPNISWLFYDSQSIFFKFQFPLNKDPISANTCVRMPNICYTQKMCDFICKQNNIWRAKRSHSSLIGVKGVTTGAARERKSGHPGCSDKVFTNYWLRQKVLSSKYKTAEWRYFHVSNLLSPTFGFFNSFYHFWTESPGG